MPKEAPQHEARRQTVTAKVPLNDVYIAFQMEGRLDKGYYAVELMSDILSRGHSSRLYKALVKDQQIFSAVHAYISGSIDTGMFVFQGKPLEHISVEQAEGAIWEQLELLKTGGVPADELTKVKNKTESTMIFSEMSLLEKGMNLAWFELLGDAENINQETARYINVTSEEIKMQANLLFRRDNSSTLIYLAEKSEAELAEI